MKYNRTFKDFEPYINYYRNIFEEDLQMCMLNEYSIDFQLYNFLLGASRELQKDEDNDTFFMQDNTRHYIQDKVRVMVQKHRVR